MLERMHKGLNPAIAILFVVSIATVQAGCGGEGDGGKTGTQTTAAQTATTQTTKPAATSFKNAKYGISFDYPSDWRSKDVEDPGIASFGDDSSSCSFVFYKGGVPSSTNRQSLIDYAQRKSRKTEKKAEDYDLTAIKVEEAQNAEGVSITRKATIDGESTAVHLTYFFAEGNRYLIDCITEPDKLDEVDRSEFEPLIKSVKIDPPDALERPVEKRRDRRRAVASKGWKGKIRTYVLRLGNVKYASVRGANPVDIRIGVSDPDDISVTLTEVVDASLGVRPNLDVKVTAAGPKGEFVGWAEWDATKDKGYLHPPTGPSKPIKFDE